MRPPERYDAIVKLIHRTGEISVDELAASMAVSRETIRRDLAHLDAEGRIKKFHGGARLLGTVREPSAEGPFALRLAESAESKKRIGRKAAEILKPGDSLFIDTGTTTLMLADALVELSSLVVITNSWRIATVVSGNPTHKVFLIGGAYASDAGESLGQFAIDQIRRFRAIHAFLTVGSVEDSGVLDFDALEAEVARAMIERVDHVTVLADHAKFTRRGIFEVAPWSGIDRLVVDAKPPDLIMDAIRKSRKTEIVHASRDAAAARA